MPTMLEVHQPEISPETNQARRTREPVIECGGMERREQPAPVRVLFSDSLLESGAPRHLQLRQRPSKWSVKLT